MGLNSVENISLPGSVAGLGCLLLLIVHGPFSFSSSSLSLKIELAGELEAVTL